LFVYWLESDTVFNQFQILCTTQRCSQNFPIGVMARVLGRSQPGEAPLKNSRPPIRNQAISLKIMIKKYYKLYLKRQSTDIANSLQYAWASAAGDHAPLDFHT